MQRPGDKRQHVISWELLIAEVRGRGWAGAGAGPGLGPGNEGRGYVKGCFSCFHLNLFPWSGLHFAVAFIGNSSPASCSSRLHIFPPAFQGPYSRLSSLPGYGR